MATCRIHEIDEKYEWIECSREAWELDPEGLCLLCSRQPDKDKDGAFTKAIRAKLRLQDYNFRGVFFPGPFNLRELTGKKNFIFAKTADFIGAKFTKGANFSEATFTQDANFSWATFHQGNFNGVIFIQDAIFYNAQFTTKEADFSEVQFTQKAEFIFATFTQGANFSKANFKEKANFSNVTFIQKVNFSEATFLGELLFFDAKSQDETNFSSAIFQGVAFFVNSSFWGKADFFKATFKGQARFVKLNPQEHQNKGEAPPSLKILFNNLNLGKESDFILQDLSLEQVAFYDTDLRRVGFLNVTWARLEGRNVVYAEIHLYQTKKRPTKESLARVEESYRQIKLSYELGGDLKNAGDFHYGEMEMHRRANPWRWFPLYWYNLYWLTSGYGERPLRSLLVLWGLFLTFAGLFFWLEPNMWGGQSWEGFGNSLFYVFQQGTLQRPPLPDNPTLFTKVLASLIPVLIPGQVALFFLALRNRLGRRR